jgi:hypothetical protein
MKKLADAGSGALVLIAEEAEVGAHRADRRRPRDETSTITA